MLSGIRPTEMNRFTSNQQTHIISTRHFIYSITRQGYSFIFIYN